jgi:hypothetical protein
MLTKEKIIAAIQAMPENDFEDIDVLLERISVLGKEEQDTNILHEPETAYGTTNIDNGLEDNPHLFSTERDAEMMAHIEKKLNEATDPETIYLIKKIKHSLENVQAGNFYTIEQAEAKINS